MSEREYALHVLLAEYLGLSYQVEKERSSQDYILECGGMRVVVGDGFFSAHAKPLGYLSKEHIPETAPQCKSAGLEGQVLIFGKDVLRRSGDAIYCGLDVFAGAFFMLSRWEEVVVEARDVHGRFPASSALAYRSGFLSRPVVNEYASLLRHLLQEAGVPQDAFTRTDPRTILTVDADFPVYWHSFAGALRRIVGAGVRLRSPGAAVKEMMRYVADRRSGSDPYDTFDLLAGLAERHHCKLSFFFMAGGRSAYDSRQTVEKPRVHRICQRLLEKGHNIGFHPSYAAAADHALFEREAQAFTASLGIPVECGRQHYLRFQVPETWRFWEMIGAQWESTMGYAAAPGFRCGTCKPFPVYDVRERRMLTVYERPFTLMDVTLRDYLSLDPDRAVILGRELRKKTKAHNGEFVVLWHNSSFFTPDWQGYENVLRRILE